MGGPVEELGERLERVLLRGHAATVDIDISGKTCVPQKDYEKGSENESGEARR